MRRDSSAPAVIFSRVREALGLSPEDALLSTLTLEALLRHTRRQLLESARHLGLSGLHRLRKDALALRFFDGLRALGLPVADADEPADRPHRFDLGPAAETSAPVRDIPWSYGQDRVTAMVVDPETLYVYWEIGDDAIARARHGLGPGGRDASLHLRVYDVTGRIFDGTNAHSYFDHAVARTDRQWFFFIGRPSSTAVVELGLKSHEGYFVRVARSGRAEFPRREPMPSGPVEWLTVRSATGDVGEPATDMRPPAAVAAHGHPGSDAEAIRVWDIRRTHAAGVAEIVGDDDVGRRWERFRWTEEDRIEWEGDAVHASWEAGPFPYPVELPRRVEERHAGTVTVGSVDGRTHVVYGPWRVVIRGLAARAERRILAIWNIHRSWAVETRVARRTITGDDVSGAAGASERMMLGASEFRLGGASELYGVGASELRYLGASEMLYAGASEWRTRGASERRFAGASEWRGGASDRHAGIRDPADPMPWDR